MMMWQWEEMEGDKWKAELIACCDVTLSKAVPGRSAT